MFEVFLIPVLQDNYVYVLRNNATDETAVVDPSVSEPVLDFLDARKWQLNAILNTHHHWDHVGGNEELKQATGCEIIGYRKDAHRIPGIDIELDEGDSFTVAGETGEVLTVPGHTLGHVLYYFADQHALFCGDTLFSMGCGRLFEGTPEQMFHSLSKFKELPPETKIYCGHEYTEANGKFALELEPDNEDILERMEEVQRLRANDEPTLPVTLDIEFRTNPFLRAQDAETFAKIRELKDNF